MPQIKIVETIAGFIQIDRNLNVPTRYGKENQYYTKGEKKNLHTEILNAIYISKRVYRN